MSAALIGTNARRSLVALESVGWTLRAADVDLVTMTARVEIAGHDGLLLTLDVRNGRGTVTRERARASTHAVGRRGDRAIVERLSMVFLGRAQVEGVRSGLRYVATYIADNTPRLSLTDARRALAPLLGAEAQEGRDG